MSGTAVAYDSTSTDVSLDVLRQAGRRRYLALFFAEHVLGPDRFARLFGPTRERLRGEMQEYFAGWPQNERRPVPEIRFSTHGDLYRTHVPAWEPVVLRGVAKHWPAVQQWTLDFFAEKYGDTTAVMGDQHGLFGEGETGAYEVTTLRKLIAAIRAGEKKALRFSPVIEENPGLKDYLDMEWFSKFRGPFSVRGLVQLFLAPNATYTPIHCALESNAFLQIYGRKRWLLWPAMYQQLIEPPADRRPYFHTDYLPGRSSPRFPLGHYAPAYETVLEPGDVLFFGPFVWHYVENLGATIAAAYRFFHLRTAMRSSWPLTVAKFMATKPSLIQTLYYSLTKTNFYYKPRVQ